MVIVVHGQIGPTIPIVRAHQVTNVVKESGGHQMVAGTGGPSLGGALERVATLVDHLTVVLTAAPCEQGHHFVHRSHVCLPGLTSRSNGTGTQDWNSPHSGLGGPNPGRLGGGVDLVIPYGLCSV
jgi:hypothetical protein